MMAVIVGLALGGGVQAAPMYATNIAYFNSSGTLVGQKIQWCNNVRHSRGNVSSPYQRHDWYPCSPASDPVAGYVCNGGSTTGHPTNTTLRCNWVTTVSPSGGIGVDGGNMLPPGMSVEDSCVMTGDCYPQPPEPFVYPSIP